MRNTYRAHQNIRLVEKISLEKMGGREASDSKKGHQDLESFQEKPNNKGQEILN